jgi:flavin reductase (DIM6/NTAB) family NADH-FMN oxidoreductase RutF
MMKLMADPGALLTTIDGQGRPNVMAIGWCHVGIVWGKPTCIVYVRPSRFTYANLEQSPEFVVNMPGLELSRATAICGVKSGRDGNKFKLAGLTTAPAKRVKPPIVEHCLLYYECRILYHTDTNSEILNRDILATYFPSRDLHRMFFGEILACYGEPDVLQRI